ncbi:MAG: SIMPL domain-containing protein [Eubacteriales bacterium]|nr:SIMPL domain-containing protein [Eubacteriales bacterium]
MRTITVTGTGSVSTRPDFIVLDLTVDAMDLDYEKSLSAAEAKVAALRKAIRRHGFAARDLKTADFNVHAEYEGREDEHGRYRNVFVGYRVRYGLRLSFSMDGARLGRIIGAVGGAEIAPELRIRFTVKEPAALRRELLEDAAANARRKAEILAAASGVKLGELMSVDYRWNEADPVSATGFQMDQRCLARPMAKNSFADMEPEEIKLNDSATFVWEIA